MTPLYARNAGRFVRSAVHGTRSGVDRAWSRRPTSSGDGRNDEETASGSSGPVRARTYSTSNVLVLYAFEAWETLGTTQ